VSTTPQPTAPGPTLGSCLPEIRLPDQTGQPLDLTAARAGRPAIIVVFRSAQW
jgi:peroxiredoxin